MYSFNLETQQIKVRPSNSGKMIVKLFVYFLPVVVSLFFYNYFKDAYNGHSEYIHDICIKPESGQFLTGSEDGTIKLWSM